MNRNRSTRLAVGLAAGIAVLLAALAGWALRPADSTDVASGDDATTAAATQAATETDPDSTADANTTADSTEVDTGAATEGTETSESDGATNTEAEGAETAEADGADDSGADDAAEADADPDGEDAAGSEDADGSPSDDADDDADDGDNSDGADTSTAGTSSSGSGSNNSGTTGTTTTDSDTESASDDDDDDEVKSSVVEAPATPAGLSDTPPVAAADTLPTAPLGIGECSLDRLVIYAGAQYSNIGQNLRSALPQTGFGADCAQPVTVLAANCPLQFSGVLNAGAAYDPNTPYYAASAAVDTESLEKVLGTIADPGAAISPLDFAYTEGDAPGERWVAVFIPPSFDGWQTLAGAAGVDPTPTSQCTATGQVG